MGGEAVSGAAQGAHELEGRRIAVVGLGKSGRGCLAALAGTASYLFYYKAIGTIGASRGMALNISYSAWAVVFALVLLRTVPSPLQVGCCIVILTGTVLAATPDWRDLRPLRGRGRTDAGATSTTIEA